MANLRRRLSKTQRAAVVARLRALARVAKKDELEVAHRWRRDDLLVEGILREGGKRMLTISASKSLPHGQLVQASEPLDEIEPVVARIIQELKQFRELKDAGTREA